MPGWRRGPSVQGGPRAPEPVFQPPRRPAGSTLQFAGLFGRERHVDAAPPTWKGRPFATMAGAAVVPSRQGAATWDLRGPRWRSPHVGFRDGDAPRGVSGWRRPAWGFGVAPPHVGFRGGDAPRGVSGWRRPTWGFGVATPHVGFRGGDAPRGVSGWRRPTWGFGVA